MEELRQKLLDACNSSGLPLEAILFVTKDLWRDVQDTLERYKKEEVERKAQEAKAAAQDAEVTEINTTQSEGE